MGSLAKKRCQKRRILIDGDLEARRGILGIGSWNHSVRRTGVCFPSFHNTLTALEVVGGE